jgi:hypothetical protein
MAESSSRTVMCSVLFAELLGYAQLPASEQLQRKRMLKAQVAQELVQVPMAERVVHDIETGIAVAFLVDAEAALATAIGLQADTVRLPLRIGLSLGTVHVVADLNGRTSRSKPIPGSCSPRTSRRATSSNPSPARSTGSRGN